MVRNCIQADNVAEDCTKDNSWYIMRAQFQALGASILNFLKDFQAELTDLNMWKLLSSFDGLDIGKEMINLLSYVVDFKDVCQLDPRKTTSFINAVERIFSTNFIPNSRARPHVGLGLYNTTGY